LPSTGAHQKDVPGADPQPGLDLGRLQVLGEDRGAGLEGVGALGRRYVQQYAPAHHAGGQVVDPQLQGPVGGDSLGRVAVVDAALVEDVAEGVDVAGGIAMRRDGEVVGASPFGVGAEHVVDGGVRVV